VAPVILLIRDFDGSYLKRKAGIIVPDSNHLKDHAMTAGRKPLVPRDTSKDPVIMEAEAAAFMDNVIQSQIAAETAENQNAAQLVMDYEEVLRQVGQIEAFEFTRCVGDVAIAQIFENLRTSGKYKGLPYKDKNGNTRRIGSLEELCREKLGKSYNRCIELSQNLRHLGPELFEAPWAA
jgi:hypothetical protein